MDSFPGKDPAPGHPWASAPVPARDQTHVRSWNTAPGTSQDQTHIPSQITDPGTIQKLTPGPSQDPSSGPSGAVSSDFSQSFRATVTDPAQIIKIRKKCSSS